MSQEVTEATNSPHQHDPDGDVVLVVGEEAPKDAQKFRVSSKVLSLASPVFAKLFSGRFAEGIEVQRGTCPEIVLPADDPGAMDEIFRIVHFLEPKDSKPPNTKLIAEIATHANKYDCIKAVRPRMVNWLRSSDLKSLPLGPADIGCLLLSAFLFQDQESFSFFSIRAQKSMTPDDFDHWESNELLQPPLFPAEIENTLRRKVEKLSGRFFGYLQSVEVELYSHKGGLLMDGKYCPKCERTHPSNAKRCHHCAFLIEEPKYCNSDLRLALYVGELGRAKLRPTSQAELNNRSGMVLLDKIKLFAASLKLKHSCNAGDACPLKSTVSNRVSIIEKIMNEIPGLQLSDFQ